MKKVIVLLSAIILIFLPSAAKCPTEGPDSGKTSSTNIFIISRLNLMTSGQGAYVNGDFLRISAEGTFAKDFSYIVRQRLNKAPKDENFFDATDYLRLNWKKNDWEIGAGKYIIACGDYEYQESSYNIYMLPLFYDGLAGMYTFLADVTRKVGTEKLKFQISNSMYAPGISDLVGISFNLDGRVGIWQHNWSINGFEREKGKWNGFLCIGNIFHLNKLDLYASITHRMDMAKPTFLKDFSSSVKFRYSPTEWMNIIGKTVWEYKEYGIEDPMLPDGTDNWMVGGGFEFFPLKGNRNIRLHCIGWSNGGVFNSLTGLTWHLDLIKN